MKVDTSALYEWGLRLGVVPIGSKVTCSEVSENTAIAYLDTSPKFVIKVLRYGSAQFKRAKFFAETFKGISCSAVGIVKLGNVYCGVFEYIEGDSLRDSILSGKLGSREAMTKVSSLVRKLDTKLEESNRQSFISEVESLRRDLKRLNKTGILRNVEFEIICDVILSIETENGYRARQSSGDLTAYNIILDKEGNASVIDIEYSQYTHFYLEDLMRFVSFSQIDIDRSEFVDQIEKSEWDRAYIYMWLRQCLLESDKLVGRELERAIAHNLYKIAFVLKDYVPSSALSNLWLSVQLLGDSICSAEEKLESQSESHLRLIDKMNEQLKSSLLEKDSLYQAEIDRIGQERDKMLRDKDKVFENEIARVSRERDRMLADKDVTYQTEIDRIGQERDQMLRYKDKVLKNEIARMGQERDQMLADKDSAYRAEIDRIGRERDRMLADKDAAYRAEIDRVSQERDKMLRDKDTSYMAEIQRICDEREKLLEIKDGAFREEMARLVDEREDLLAQKTMYYENQIRTLLVELEQSYKSKENELLERLNKTEERLTHESRRLKASVELQLSDSRIKYNEILPLITIIVVDYNGARFLQTLFSSLCTQSYRAFKVILVLNGDSEESTKVVENFDRFLNIEIIDSPNNLGFTGGNNVAFNKVDTELFVLLNNDTVPSEDWLYHLYRRINTNRKVAAVASKVLFNSRYREIVIKSNTFCPAELGESSDTRNLGLYTSFSLMKDQVGKALYKEGFYLPEQHEGREWRWTAGCATAWVPSEPKQSILLHYRIHPRMIGSYLELESRELKLRIQLDSETGTVEIPGATDSDLFDVVNNAGSYITEERDIGDIGIFEKDDGSFDHSREVDAICGCSVMFRKSAIGEVLFPEKFFAYYEDTDVSWRLRKEGHKLVYEPLSVVRHVHSGSSGTDTPFFHYHIYRNYRWLLVRNAGNFRSVMTLVLKELQDYKKAVGGLDVEYNQKRLKRDCIWGMLKYAAQRFFG